MRHIKIVVFFLVVGVLYSCGNKLSIQRNFTNHESLFQNLNIEVESKMKKHNLKGLSVAVFENYEIIWSNQWGIKSSENIEEIDKHTAFSTASISKPITALLCGILEEKGLINLEEPISKYLKRWKLPESKFTEDTKVTWLHLLSHTAGTSQGGFADFYLGDEIPTIVQSLKGELVPRYDKEIGFLFKPGTDFEYSGGGYVIIQMALEDTFNKPLAELADEYLFNPLGLENTTMKQPNENGFLQNVAKVHNREGEVIKTGLPITPQVAPSGMWSCPSDMAKIALEVQNALRNKNNKVISNAVAKRLTSIATLKKIGSWSSGGWGFGWRRSLAYGNLDWFSHSGSNTGVGGELMATMQGGNGIAVLANGDRPNRHPLIHFLKNEIIKLKGWNLPMEKSIIKKPSQKLIGTLKGSYIDFLFNSRGRLQIIDKNGKLFLKSRSLRYIYDSDKSEMFYLGNNTFRINNYPNFIHFVINESEEIKSIEIYRNNKQKNKIVIPVGNVRNEISQLFDIFLYKKMDLAIAEYKEIKKSSPQFSFENILNQFGYEFYNDGKIMEAIEILKLNCKENPSSWNTYDSLAEIYCLERKFKKSIENYRIALDLNNDQAYKDRILKLIIDLENKLKKV